VIYNQTLSIANTGGIVGAVLHLERTHSAGQQQPETRPQAGRHSAPATASGVGISVTAKYLAGLTLALTLFGCGNTYRPVVAAINPVGPAGQPQKYALAISTPTQNPLSTNAPISFVGTWNATTAYTVNQGVTYQGSQYVSLRNNVGQNPTVTPAPPALPYWSVVSNGLMTMVDFSGDTVLVTASLGLDPYYFTVNASGTTGYTLNNDKTVNSFDISTSLISSNVLFTTLLPGASPVSVLPLTTSTYMADPGLNAIDQLTGTPPALKQELPVGANSIYVTGVSGAARLYALNQGATGTAGTVSAIETTNNAISATLPVGIAPVYGVMSADGRRAYILNQTTGTPVPVSGTVTVINVQTNALDSFPNPVPNPPTPLTSTITVGQSPIWADFAPTRDELVVLNEGLGTSSQGSVSIVNIPLCNTNTLPANPNCDANNPVDATGFGQVIATVPVGINPIMVSVLSDGTRAYVANAGTGLTCAVPGVAPVTGKTEACTISVVNLTSNTVTATIPVNGHPVYLATTNSTPTGKVYVVAKDSTVMTVIETDTDTVDTTIPLQGYGVSVRVTQP
jgi:DNA-binding beta-propeller fold protein YncE